MSATVRLRKLDAGWYETTDGAFRVRKDGDTLGSWLLSARTDDGRFDPVDSFHTLTEARSAIAALVGAWS